MHSAPRKVLFIHHGGGIGGAPVSMLQMAAALDRERYTPLALFTENGPILDLAHELNVPTQVEDLRSAFFYSAHVPLRLRMLAAFALHFMTTVRDSQRIVRKLKPSLVHLNTSVLLPVALGIRFEGVPIVWHVREVPGPHPLLRKFQTDTITRLSDRIVVNSEYVRGAFPRDADAMVLHNALDLERFNIPEEVSSARVRAEFHLSPSSPIVGMLGSVQEAKGHYLLLDAALEIVRKIPEVRFLIVSGGVDKTYQHSWKGRIKHIMGWPMDNLDRMHRLINKLGLEKYFVFTGFRTNIVDLLVSMDVLAFIPQAAEGFGRPLLEGMAAGRAIVATDVGPSREILGEKAGLLVPTGNARVLANAITELLGDQDRRQTMGAIGRRRARQFDMPQHVSRVEEVYDQVLGSVSSQ